MYLFGSAARGDMHRGSDVDIAVHSKKSLTLSERMRISRSVRRMFHVGNREIDLVDLRHLTPELAMQIIQDGKRLIGTDRADDEFFRLSMKRYIDAKKIRDAQAEYVKQYATL